ncbi:hypothetical protein BB560_007158 [Smittium megazygosporum]|uniref:Exocyst complex component Sec10-like alpha-helical bundle domain-containing protein n=1 Tax=Smittium megazygosporum TaxID=133381 RepID=A0A2T9XYA5_9FUNG|nr:hypothetical protein BB560_007158 [Smittium megazygosporum]
MIYKEYLQQDQYLCFDDSVFLPRTVISVFVDEMLKKNGVIGKCFRSLFEKQLSSSNNGVSFIKTIVESFKLLLKYINIWDTFFCELPTSNIEMLNTEDDIYNTKKRQSYSLVPKTIPINSMFYVLNKCQFLKYFGFERENIKIGISVALKWYASGMPKVVFLDKLTDEQQVFFSEQIVAILRNNDLIFKSKALRMRGDGTDNDRNSKFSKNQDSPKGSNFSMSTKFIKIFDFAEHRKELELFKLEVNNVFLRILGFELGCRADLSTIVVRKVDSSLGTDSPSLLNNLDSPSGSEANSPNISGNRNFFPRQGGNVSGFSVSEAPKTNFITAVDLLKNLGFNHMKPAFDKIINDLKKLQSQIGTVSGLVSAVKMASAQREVPKFEMLDSSPEKMDQQNLGSLQNVANSLASSKKKTIGATSKVTFSSISFDLLLSTNELQLEQQMREILLILELKFFELVHLSDLVLQLVNEYYEIKMKPFVDPDDFLSPVHIQKRVLNTLVDDCVATGVDLIIEIIIRQLEHVLKTEQKEEDYLPKSTVSLQLKPTMACVHCVQLLNEASEIIRSLSKSDKAVCSVYMSEIGTRLFGVLQKHLFGYTISEPGGFQLIADLNLYNDWATSNLDDNETLMSFKTLKDLASCFIIAPKELRGFLQELYSRRAFDNVLRSEEVYDIVARRADYKNIRGLVEGHCDFM